MAIYQQTHTTYAVNTNSSLNAHRY